MSGGSTAPAGGASTGGASSRGTATKDRIIDAALETVREEGFAETTARAIARHGGFNQALIFYHFGSVDDLLQVAFMRASMQNVERYREAVKEVGSLSDLVSIARRLHAEDLESGSVTAVTQLMAAATDATRGGALLDRFDEWIGLVQQAVERASAVNPMAGIVPAREAAYAICAMFLGIELLSRLDPVRSQAQPVFDLMETVAALIEQVDPALIARLVPPEW